MIESVLVANRGEIARRVFRTCRDLGIATVAVYSDADAGAPHVREADSAVRLPGNAPADTYLRGDLIVAAAKAAGADAVHPGYGFLSENAGFARAVLDAGLVWIGPSPDVIEAMGSKTRAKTIMAAASVPVLTGLRPESIGPDDLPVLVKAAAGGGGRGMRIVRDLALLDEELAAARAEAASAFGDGEVFVEPFVETGRHIEVQLLADTHGTVWTLGERDCSVQRRHQKVIEETPAPGIDDTLRRTLHDAAAAAARAIGYTGAGTVEFLVAPGGRPYFLEVNTRLQVEHPVTECVTGIDLVRLQLSIAEGAVLPAEPPAPHGHAIEARLYAEDPARGWQPQSGVLHRMELPELPGLRLDSGVESGDTIGVHYDPMLAKVIAWADTRDEAVRLLARALDRARLHGPVTNRELLVRVLRHPEFAAGRHSTAFLEQHPSVLAGDGADADAVRLAALAAALSDASGRSTFGGWRNVPSQPQAKSYATVPGAEPYEVRYRLTRSGLDAPDHPGVRLLHAERGHVVLEADGVRRAFDVAVYGDRVHVDCALGAFAFTAMPRFPVPESGTEPGSLLAPMPGTVIRIGEFSVGDHVEAGRPLLWLEAMKMEHRITAPASGTLTALNAEVGRQVDVGAVLAVVKEEARP
ncbi:biotin carboxylase N-terminal domain-containing protein [Streptomyces sp. SPB162]|uniref:acetyl/propionyl/methylcrotonyl-CoA carboxylase subunit alpha n=1 Tax=Streptomyces sp. SPB162 TaxID=2940560 RepID=UPI0024072D6E|nr:biotin carboxylase N-terminal domain-containing protein [Streptomyces sp. SPB162]